MKLSSVGGVNACAFVRLLMVVVVSVGFWPSAAGAGEPGAPAIGAATRFATVVRIRGEVTATAWEDAGSARTLREGDAVFVGERIRATGGGEAVLKTEDAGLIALRPWVEFAMERYAARGTSADVFALRLIAGGLRVITGWIGRTNRNEHRVVTATATIGLRGTDHEPYVMTPELGKRLTQNDGVYDKVNRGGTTMDVEGNRLDIDPGRVGFVRSRAIRIRGMMTILLPVLLDKVPDFFVPGQFDDELDRLSRTADEDALRALDEVRKLSPGEPPALVPDPAAPAVPAPIEEPATQPTPARAGAASVPAPAQAAPVGAECAADEVAKTWLGEFDAAIERRDAPAIVRKFAPEVSIRVAVHDASGQPTTVELQRDELAQSTIAALAELTDYQQRRTSIEGHPAGEGAQRCERIGVRSVVIEQGRRSGKPYRFESVEAFLLERRAGAWLAIRAETTQR